MILNPIFKSVQYAQCKAQKKLYKFRDAYIYFCYKSSSSYRTPGELAYPDKENKPGVIA